MIQVKQNAQNLITALSLSLEHDKTISFVGGGGKTSLIFALAQEFASEAKKVFISTTTQMQIPPQSLDYTFLSAESIESSENLFSNTKILVAGTITKNQKFTKLPQDIFERIFSQCDVVLIEADGAKHFPVKIPAPHEPQIPFFSEYVVVVCGLSALGKPAKEAIFRYELEFEGCSFDANHIVTAQNIVAILTSSQGSHKNITKNQKIRYVINQVDTQEDYNLAVSIAKEIMQKQKNPIALLSLQSDQKLKGAFIPVS